MINDQDVISFISQLAAINAIGGLESHADWNAMMFSPALSIQGGLDYFAGQSTFYPEKSLHSHLRTKVQFDVNGKHVTTALVMSGAWRLQEISITSSYWASIRCLTTLMLSRMATATKEILLSIQQIQIQ